MGAGKSQPIGRGVALGVTQAPSGLSGPGRGVGVPNMMNMLPTMGRGMPNIGGNIPGNMQRMPPMGMGMRMARPPVGSMPPMNGQQGLNNNVNNTNLGKSCYVT